MCPIFLAKTRLFGAELKLQKAVESSVYHFLKYFAYNAEPGYWAVIRWIRFRATFVYRYNQSLLLLRWHTAVFKTPIEECTETIGNTTSTMTE